MNYKIEYMKTNNNCSETSNDTEKVKSYAISVAMKKNAYNELNSFIKKGSLGINCEITGKTIDDAFDCMINIGKVIINAIDMPKNRKESSELCAERDFLIIREKFKSWLKEKEAK